MQTTSPIVSLECITNLDKQIGTFINPHTAKLINQPVPIAAPCPHLHKQVVQQHNSSLLAYNTSHEGN